MSDGHNDLDAHHPARWRLHRRPVRRGADPRWARGPPARSSTPRPVRRRAPWGSVPRCCGTTARTSVSGCARPPERGATMQVIDVEGPPIGPSRLWYWIAGCLLAVAVMCVTLAVAGFLSLNRQINDFQRVPAPGHGEVTFTQPGGYGIYAETRGQCCSLSVGSRDP